MSVVDEIIDKLGGRRYGDEIVSTCPFCGSEKKKFYFNTEKLVFSCKRGSCGEHGTAAKLAQKLGIEGDLPMPKGEAVEVEESMSIDMKDWREPEEDDPIIAELISRGISVETVIESGAKIEPKFGALALPAYEKGILKAVVYRNVGKRILQERGSKQILWNFDRCSPEDGKLYITEGRIDALTLLEHGLTNVASMPNGCSNMAWIENHWDALQDYKEIVLCYDNDEAGHKGIKQAASRLDFADLFEIDYAGKNDINEMYNEKFTKFKDAVENPIAVMNDGFVSLQEVSTSEGVADELFSTGLSGLDRIFGGIGLFQSTIIMASSGAGKTTMVSNMIKGILANGEKVAIFSGELSNRQLKTWVYSVIGGKEAVRTKPHPYRRNSTISSIIPEYEKKIDQLVEGKLFVYDGNKNNATQMLKHFTKLHKKNGVKYFFIDNLSILDMSYKGKDQWAGEAEFAKEVAAFTRNNMVHLFMIAHPTKVNINTEADFTKKDGSVKAIERYQQSQVRGSASLVNLAHNVLVMARAGEHERAYFKQGVVQAYAKKGKRAEGEKLSEIIEKDLGTYAYLIKNRSGGFMYEDCLMGYDPETRRIYGLLTKEEDLKREVLPKEEEPNVELTENDWEVISDDDEI